MGKIVRSGMGLALAAALFACPGTAEADGIAGVAEFHYQNGHEFARLMKYQNALIEFKKAILLDGKVGRYYSAVADIMKSLEKPGEAVAYYRQALKLDPENKEIRKNLQGIVEGRSDKPNSAAPQQKGDIGGSQVMIQPGDFLIDQTEVSIGQFQKIFPEYRGPEGFSPSMPAVNVSYAQAAEYAEKTDSRLCSQEEWQTALQFYGDVTLSKNNLHKDYHGSPELVTSGAGEVKNLLGNVAEWIQDGSGKPGYMGGHWFSEIMLQASVEQVTAIVDGEGGVARPYVGFRCCRSVR